MLIGLTRVLRRRPGAGRWSRSSTPARRCRASACVQALLTTLGVLATIKSRRGRDGGRRALRGRGRAADRTSSASPRRRRRRFRPRRAGMLLERAGDLDGAERRVRARRAARPPRRLAARPRSRAAAARRAASAAAATYAGARELAREARPGAGRRATDAGRARRAARPHRALAAARAEARRRSAADGELSDREIAVLRLLATDLSQREIGAELFVSFNTVKTPHAHGVPQARRDEPRGRGRARARARACCSEPPWVIRGLGDAPLTQPAERVPPPPHIQGTPD